ncbi:elongation factor G [Pararhodobacter sp. SW119]|uniref:elongation factor G n=1 Tax=Pararhodobacter sp. SW119 TaxID=2780075 RepID=UPI001ADF4BC2|nr:elongation factor G [Pararhodobacter sp. SW119]
MRCITVLGPSQSGKSTLVQHLAALDGGRGTSETMEPLTMTTFEYLGEPWCALDLPGGSEYAALAQGALMASDAAVLVAPADPEAAMLAAPWLRVIEASGTPCFLFVNKMDATTARVRDIVSELQGYSNHSIVLRQIPIREGETVVGAVDLISERAWRYRDGQQSALVRMPAGPVAEREAEARGELLEQMSEYDDALLEELIEDREPATGALYAIARRELSENVLIPAFLGAAERSNGVNRLMKALRHEAPDAGRLRERLGGARAVAFQAEIRKHLGKVVAIRALEDGMAIGQTLAGGNLGGLQKPGGGAGGPMAAGEVALAVKSDHLGAGLPLRPDTALPRPDWAAGHTPMLTRVLIPGSERDEVRLSAALSRLAECDPFLRHETEDETGQPVLRTQGPQHLRRVLAVLETGFGLTVTTREPQVPWRETISGRAEVRYRHRKQTGGAGQFADVALIIEPLPRGEGFRFSETVKGGAVPRNYIPSVAEGAEDAMDRGPLGFPVIDISVTLTDGKHHAVDSSDHAFRTAGRMGTREGLTQAGPLLLQAIERIDIHVPSACSGALVSLISGLKGQVLGFDRDPDQRGWDLFRATLPATARDDLLGQLAGVTQGTAWLEASFDHFEEVYGREADAISKARLAALA